MEENKRDTEKKERKSRRWVILILILLAAVAVAAFFLSDRFGTMLKRGTSYTLAKTGNTVALERDGSTMTENLGDLILRANKEGVRGITAEGQVRWDVAYTMSRPYLSVAGTYAAVADRRGQEAVIIDQNGTATRVTAENPILFHGVNEAGILALVTIEEDGHSITLYSFDGSKLLKRRTYEKRDGVPVALALSADGQRMTTSFLSYAGTSLSSTVTAFDLSSSGTGLKDRILGSKKFDDTLISDLYYIGNHCVYIGDHRIGALDTSSGCEESWEENLKYQIRAVAFGEEAFAVALGQGMAGTGSAAEFDFWIYNGRGSILSKKNLGGITGLTAAGDVFVCSNGRSYTAFDIKGSVRWYLDAEEDYYKLLPFGDKKTVAAESGTNFTYYEVKELAEVEEGQ